MKLTAKGNVHYDGKRYKAGATIDVKDDDQAQGLIDAGAAEAAGDADDTKAKAKTTSK
ncbi:hypothetical protein [Hypericibacter sp.]|uniref:DUF7210 family protein n=1 Tax=Hypericibacter sp. TaxID=2705401 RepID=UPI003D6CBD57